MIKHFLFSENFDSIIASFDSFDKEAIKNSIIQHLTEYPSDIVEHTREYNKKDIKRFYGYNILNFYGINPKTGKPSLLIEKNDKTYYKQLS